jgi:hypothetical protein
LEFMACEEKRQLVAEYEMAAKKFAKAVSDLREKAGTSAKKEYDQLSRVSDDARIKSEQARLAVEQHVAGHDC